MNDGLPPRGGSEEGRCVRSSDGPKGPGWDLVTT